jgi:hypothetical protein
VELTRENRTRIGTSGITRLFLHRACDKEKVVRRRR